MTRPRAGAEPPGRYEAIWRAVRRVPRGRVATYGQIAAEAGQPGHARLVGYALHALSGPDTVPWHRILNARGTVSLTGSGRALQIALLRSEGVRVSAEGRVELSRYRWRPR